MSSRRIEFMSLFSPHILALSMCLILFVDECMRTSSCFRTYFPTSLQNISLLQQKKPINCSVRTEFNCCPLIFTMFVCFSGCSPANLI